MPLAALRTDQLPIVQRRNQLLDEFDLSTKVGFFRDGHHLEPARLRGAVEEPAEHLGRRPNTVLLHNPETSPAGFAAACEALAAMREAGLFERWGISTWDPRRLLYSPYRGPRPDVLMVRAGLVPTPPTVPTVPMVPMVPMASGLSAWTPPTPD